MAETITSFNTFFPGRKARAQEVNSNFDAFRGTCIPVASDTETATDLTNTAGTTTYRWRNVYAQSHNLLSVTTTGNFSLEPDPDYTAGAILFKFGSVTSHRFKKDSSLMTTTSVIAESGVPATSGAVVIVGTSIAMQTTGKRVYASFMLGNLVTSTASGFTANYNGAYNPPYELRIDLIRDNSVVAASTNLFHLVHYHRGATTTAFCLEPSFSWIDDSCPSQSLTNYHLLLTYIGDTMTVVVGNMRFGVMELV